MGARSASSYSQQPKVIVTKVLEKGYGKLSSSADLLNFYFSVGSITIFV
jgi:hypothetical protein